MTWEEKVTVVCVDQQGVPPLLPRDQRGPADRIHPDELTRLGQKSVAWVSTPKRSGKATPIVILCHERYGVVQHTVELAEKLAEAGFLTLAPDFYADLDLTGNEDRLPDISDASAQQHLDAAVGYARNLDIAGPSSPLAVIGVCRTGSIGILADAERADVNAVVMLYGGAQKREFHQSGLRTRPYADMLRNGNAPVLGLWGERDHTMSVDDVRRVRDFLEEGRRSYQFVVYEDMPHGWLNDTMPGRFRDLEARETLELIAGWLHVKFAQPGPEEGVSWEFTSRISQSYDFSSNTRIA